MSRNVESCEREQEAHVLLRKLSRELSTVKYRSEERARKLANSRQVRVALVQRQSLLVDELEKSENAMHGFRCEIAAARRRARAARRILRASILARAVRCFNCENIAAVAVAHAANLQSAGGITGGGCRSLVPKSICCFCDDTNNHFERSVADMGLILTVETLVSFSAAKYPYTR